MKKCGHCKEEKTFEQFFKNSATKSGLSSSCKVCAQSQSKLIREKYRDAYSAHSKAYYAKNAEKRKAYAETRKTEIRNNALKLNYGIAIEDYNRMLEAQNHCCEMCGKHKSGFKNGLAVDHNHETGRVRGLLCFGCNKYRVAGHNVKTAQKVVEYLVKYDRSS